MSPKERASEFIDKYMDIDLSPLSEYGNYLDKETAKKCALIAIDEIRDNISLISEIQDYWIQVQNEIKLL